MTQKALGESTAAIVSVPQDRDHIRYIAIAAMSFFAILAATLALNTAVDPLWYEQGNQLTRHNFGFDERLSKTLRFLKSPNDYNCILFGSSRAIMLDVKKIRGQNCYNYAVSGADFVEMTAFARYVRAQAVAPRLIVIDVDNFNFNIEPMPDETPSYIRTSSKPPTELSRYLSFDVAVMSFKALINDGPKNRYYTRDFRNDPAAPDGSYKPEVDLVTPRKKVHPAEIMIHGYGPYAPAKASNLAEFRAIFPNSALVGYVSPTSAYQVVRELRNGRIDDYIDAIYEASLHFDRFIDFAIPSPVTQDPRNTYDGSHFSPDVNARIAESLTIAKPLFGIVVTGMSRDAYRKAFLAAARAFETTISSGE